MGFEENTKTQVIGDGLYPPMTDQKTGFQRFMMYAKSLIFAAISVYTIVALFQALTQVNRKDTQLTPTTPSDRCLPFFDDIKAFLVSKNGTHSSALYDYQAGRAITRICTSHTHTEVHAAVTVQQKDVRPYDPWVIEGKCDIINSAVDRAGFVQNCEILGYAAGSIPTCQQFATTELEAATVNAWNRPIHWNHWVRLLSGNKTFGNGTSVPYSSLRCPVQINRYTQYANCSTGTVYAFEKNDRDVRALMVIGVIAPFVVLIGQFVCVYLYEKGDNKWSSEKGWMLAFASRGAPGSLFLGYWVCNTGKDGRGDWPDPLVLNFGGWLACAVSDVFEGLVIPITAVIGCNLSRFPVNVVLIVIKILKFVFDTSVYLYYRGDIMEPGGWDEQTRHAVLSDPTKALACKDFGVVVPGITDQPEPVRAAMAAADAAGIKYDQDEANRAVAEGARYIRKQGAPVMWQYAQRPVMMAPQGGVVAVPVPGAGMHQPPMMVMQPQPVMQPVIMVQPGYPGAQPGYQQQPGAGLPTNRV